MEDGRIAGDQSRFPQKDWNERRRLKDLPIQMAERAKLARLTAANFPGGVELDDDFCPWIWVEQEGVWISFDGNYSAKSPEQKRNDHRERKEKQYGQAVYHLGAQFYWSIVRRDVLNRDKFTCQLCGAVKPSKLHIHHVQKRRAGGPDFWDNLITVCPSCHRPADTENYDPDWIQIPCDDPYYVVVADSYKSLGWHAIEWAKGDIREYCQKFNIDIDEIEVLELQGKPEVHRYDSASIADMRDRLLRGIELANAGIAKAYENSMRKLINEIAASIDDARGVHKRDPLSWDWLCDIELNLRDMLDIAADFEALIAEIRTKAVVKSEDELTREMKK